MFRWELQRNTQESTVLPAPKAVNARTAALSPAKCFMNTPEPKAHSSSILYGGCVAAAITLLVGVSRIAPPDLAFYYAYAESLALDLDFAFANQYDRFPFAVHELYEAPTGLPANDWPMGTGIAWLPFLLVGSILSSIVASLGWLTNENQRLGTMTWSITLGATLLYGYGTLVLAALIGKRYVQSRSARLWGLLAIALGSSVTYHLLVNTADSHLPSAFFIGLFLWLWWRWQDTPTMALAFLAGLALGMAALIRPHNAVFALTPLLHMLLIQRSATQWDWRSIILCMAGAVLAFLPQIIVWQTIYGHPLELPRSGDVLWLQPHLFEMLFSDFHGMISWSPLLGLALLGLCMDRKALPLLIPLMLIMYVYACNIAWWAGGSFGNRRMVSFAPVFIIGLSILLEKNPKAWIKGLVVLCGGWTFALLLAEAGGSLPLDRYLQWREIFPAIPEGLVPGVVNLLTRAEWSVERLVVSLVILAGFGAAWFTCRRWGTAQRMSYAAGALAIVLVLASGIAGIRSAEANRISNPNRYPPIDRFTWLIYFEKGFYHLQNYDYTTALQSYLAATILEPRHPQAFMYVAYISDDHGWDHVAYQYYRQALRFGGRTPQFFARYEDQLNRRIRQGGDRLPRLLNERGVLLAVQSEYDAAEADFRQALRFDPEYALPQQNLDAVEKRRSGEFAHLMWE